MKLTDKIKELKDVLTEEQILSLEDDIKVMVKEEVDLRIEEKVNELEVKAEEYCEKEISEKVEAEKEKLIEEYEGKLEELEENIVEKVDQFLDSEINEQISDEAIEKLALNETFEPIITGIQELFETKYAALDSEGSKALAEAKEQVGKLEEEKDELIADKMELSELAESAAVKLKLKEATEELTETQKERVETFFEGKSFEEVEKKIEPFVAMLNESDDSDDEDDDTENINEENNFSDEDGEVTKENEEKENINESEESENDDADEDKPYTSTNIDGAQNFL